MIAGGYLLFGYTFYDYDSIICRSSLLVSIMFTSRSTAINHAFPSSSCTLSEASSGRKFLRKLRSELRNDKGTLLASINFFSAFLSTFVNWCFDVYSIYCSPVYPPSHVIYSCVTSRHSQYHISICDLQIIGSIKTVQVS